MSPANTPPEPARLRGEIPREIWAIVFAAFFVAVGFGLIAPVLPLFADKFATSVTATTIVVSALPLFRLLWAPVAGVVVNKTTEKTSYMTGLAVVAVSSAATAYADSYWELVAYRALGGIGSVMFTVAAMGLIVKYSPPLMRGKVAALYTSMFLIGNVVGPIVGGLLGGLGYRAPFLIYAGTLSIAIAIVGWMMRGTGRGLTTSSRDNPPLPPMALRDALRDRVYQASLSSAFANGWTNFGIRNAIVPLFVTAAVARESWIAGLMMAAFALGNAVALPFSARITDTVGRKPVIMWGMVVNGVLTAVFGFMGELWPLAVASVLAGVGAGLMNPGQQAAVADVVGNERSSGQVLAVFQMVQDVGSIIGPVLAGLLADALGWNAAFGMTGAIMLLCALPWLRADEPLKRHHI